MKMRANRALTEAGKDSPYRNHSVAEFFRLKEMRDGKHAGWVPDLRAKMTW
jgi:hypothetical protein